MAEPMTPSPEDVERMIERGRRLHRRASRYGAAIPATASVIAEYGEYAKDTADMLAALSAIGGEKQA